MAAGPSVFCVKAVFSEVKSLLCVWGEIHLCVESIKPQSLFIILMSLDSAAELSPVTVLWYTLVLRVQTQRLPKDNHIQKEKNNSQDKLSCLFSKV